MADSTFVLKKYPLKLRRPFTTSQQSSVGKHTLFARFGSGIGEGSSSLHYGPTVTEIMPQVQELLDRHEPFTEIDSLDHLLTELPEHLKVARCALEMAWLDCQALERGEPLYEFLSLARPSEIVSSVTITRGSSDEIKQQIEHYHDFSIYKLKVGFDGDLDLIEDVLKYREANLRLDANGGWSADETIDRVRALSGYPIEFIEQPLDEPSLSDLDKIKTKTECNIILDESIQSAEDIEEFHHVVDGISLKLAKCGGISETVKLAQLARSYNLKLLLGCMIESSVSITAGCHISSLFDYLDLDSILLIENDPAWGAQFDGETLLLPAGAGLGLVREEMNFV